MNNFKFNALRELIPEGISYSYDEAKDNVICRDFTIPADTVIKAKIAELEAQEPLRLLREQRNQIISATDWQASSDLTMTAEQTAYRQALRDLPSTATPALDENGELTGVNWPTKPE